MGKDSDNRKSGQAGKGSFKTVILLLLIGIFIYSVFRLSAFYLQYRAQERAHEEAVRQYTREAQGYEKQAEEQASKISAEDQMKTGNGGEGKDAACPIAVDFDALLAENGDIVGWLYCEDTNINYPVVQGKDNDYYLSHSYDRKESRAGAIFVDAENRPQFADSNTILYGHHMKNGGMLARLADFSDQEYFDAHSVMWLLTPEETYKVQLLGGYLTSADSDSYTIFAGACEEFDDYLAGVLAASDVHTEEETPRDGRYIMLSTCEYDFEDARYVLHGRIDKAE